MERVEITILSENYVNKSDFTAEHGLSLFINYKEKNILFDTGQTGIIIINAQKSGIDLSKTDYVILSHGHYDHTGGLNYLKKMVSNTVLVSKKSVFNRKYNKKKNKYRNIGIKNTKKSILYLFKDKIYIENFKKIENNIYAVGKIPIFYKFNTNFNNFYIKNKDEYINDIFEDELYLYIKRRTGGVIITGCSHRGILNIIKSAKDIFNQKIELVIGGFHLKDKDKKKVDKIIDIFKILEIKKIVPIHCTDLSVRCRFKSEFKNRVKLMSAGENIKL